MQAEEKRSRHRLPISCVQCRRRKRRCDRQHPCQTCIHRGEGECCSYEVQTESTVHTLRIEDVKSDNQVLRERIRRLEDLVDSYARRLEDSPSSASNSEEFRRTPVLMRSSLASPGHSLMSTDNNNSVPHQPKYKGVACWDSILMELDELKQSVREPLEIPSLHGGSRTKDSYSPAIILSDTGLSFETLFASLPPRAKMDALLSQYLTSYHPFYPIIHPPTFKKQYQAFLASPQDPVMLSQLFVMMALSIANNDPEDPTSDEYAKSALQAIQSSELTTKFNVMSVVTLINLAFYYQRERSQNTFTWIVFGFLLQIARAIGLHRDPSHFGITGQECQTRRHIWAAIMTLDANQSARFGRGICIDPDEWDTRTPERVSDDGSRLSESLAASHTYAKRATAISVAKVYKLLFSPKARPSYQTILEVEQDIRATVADMPKYSMDEIKPNSNQWAIVWLYRKFAPFILAMSLIIIHRPFLSKKSEEYLHSRLTCLQAARTTIGIVLELENQAGLENYAWYIREMKSISSVPAGTLLCIGLYIRTQPEYAPLVEDASSCAKDQRLVEEILAGMQPESHEYSILESFYRQAISARTDADGARHISSGFSIFSESGVPGHHNVHYTPVPGNVPNGWNRFVSAAGELSESQNPWGSRPLQPSEVPTYATQDVNGFPIVGDVPNYGSVIPRQYTHTPMAEELDPSAAYWAHMHRDLQDL